MSSSSNSLKALAGVALSVGALVLLNKYAFGKGSKKGGSSAKGPVDAKVPTITLSNGVKGPLKMPALGFGTWQVSKEIVGRVVTEAIELGYRHLDGAWVYGNQKEIGAALAKLFAKGTVKREELWITSKLWVTDFADVEGALAETLAELGLEYLDQYLIHWPVPVTPAGKHKPVGELKGPDHILLDTYRSFKNEEHRFEILRATWKAMEGLLDSGKVRSIGVSNFTRTVYDNVFDGSQKHLPATNQVELHPRLVQKELKAYFEAKGSPLVAYSPLGRGTTVKEDVHLLDEPLIKSLAAKYSVSPAQVLLRWSIEYGCIVIPRSSSKLHLKENLDLWSFSLSSDDVEAITKLNKPEGKGRQIQGFLANQFIED